MADNYIVNLVDKWGHVLERDGSPYLMESGHPNFEARFGDLDSARAFCEAVVRELPQVECDVQHGDQIVLQHFDVEWRQREEKQVRQMFAEHRRLLQVSFGVLVGAVLLLVEALLFLLP